jgi:Uma2 family endonuclease
MSALLTPPPANRLLTADEFAERYSGHRMELVRGLPTLLPVALPDELQSRGTAPRLVLEVLSPSETWVNVLRRIATHLKAGVKVVVILDPRSETASVYRPDVVQEVLRAADTLTVPEVLPGFAVAVATLFE